MMGRFCLLTLLLIAVAGCATNKAASRCFVVIENKRPHAEICESEDSLRYHPLTEEETATAIPPLVSAVMVAEGLMDGPGPGDPGWNAVYYDLR